MEGVLTKLNRIQNNIREVMSFLKKYKSVFDHLKDIIDNKGNNSDGIFNDEDNDSDLSSQNIVDTRD